MVALLRSECSKATMLQWGRPLTGRRQAGMTSCWPGWIRSGFAMLFAAAMRRYSPAWP